MAASASSAGCAADRRGRGEIERLHHEARDLAGARGAVVGGGGHHQLVLGPRHRDVEEPPLLLWCASPTIGRFREEIGGQLQRIAPRLHREALLDAADEEHHRELEPLGLVHGEDGDRVVVGIGLRDRGIVTGFAQQVEVGDEGGHLVVLRVIAVRLHRVEEARDVLDRASAAALDSFARRARRPEACR
jgi:hypothetical protein